MLTEQAQCALLLLHRRANKCHDTFELERFDRALDEIVRLNSEEPAPFQTRSALAHASAVMCRRRELAPCTALEKLQPHQQPGKRDMRYAMVEVLDWLRKTPELTAEQRSLLLQVIEEDDLARLATCKGIPLPRVRERVSRARKQARTAYAREAMA